jgi:hypothetical protein
MSPPTRKWWRRSKRYGTEYDIRGLEWTEFVKLLEDMKVMARLWRIEVVLMISAVPNFSAVVIF